MIRMALAISIIATAFCEPVFATSISLSSDFVIYDSKRSEVQGQGLNLSFSKPVSRFLNSEWNFLVRLSRHTSSSRLQEPSKTRIDSWQSSELLAGLGVSRQFFGLELAANVYTGFNLSLLRINDSQTNQTRIYKNIEAQGQASLLQLSVAKDFGSNLAFYSAINSYKRQLSASSKKSSYEQQSFSNSGALQLNSGSSETNLLTVTPPQPFSIELGIRMPI